VLQLAARRPLWLRPIRATLALGAALGLAVVPMVPAARAASASTPSRAKVLRIALNGYENNITPFTITFGAGPNTTDLVHLIYDSLFWSQSDANPRPWLALSATPSDNFRVWTIKLRPGVKWQDGVPLTVQDVKFSFDYYVAHFPVGARFSHHVAGFPLLQSAEVVDPSTVRVSFQQPAPNFETMPGADLPILPEHIWKDVPDPAKTGTRLFIGSGPYRLVKIVPDQLYVLKANPLYFQGKPLVGEIDLPIVTDPNASFEALRTGQVDYVTRNLPPELINQFKQISGIQELQGTRLLSTQMYFNARRAPWSDPMVRKAISLATNDQALVGKVLLGHGKPGNDGFLSPKSPWVMPKAGHEYNPAGGRQMLDAAGYRVGPDGVRANPAGQRLELHVLVSSLAPMDIRATQLMAQQVAGIGVKVDVESTDPVTITQLTRAHNFDAEIAELETHVEADPNGLWWILHTPGKAGQGFSQTGWSNSQFDALSEKVLAEPGNQAKPLLDQMQRIVASQAPVIAFYYPQEVYAYRSSAYAGWVSDFGNGLFNPLSFIPHSGKAGTASVSSSGGTNPAVIIAPVVVVLALITGAVFLSRRRHTGAEEDDA